MSLTSQRSVGVVHRQIRPNPFATRYVRPGAIEYRFDADHPVDAAPRRRIIQQLIKHRVGSLVGPHGSGKSTLVQSLLPQLHEHFDEISHLQLHAAEKRGTWHRWRHARKNAVQLLRIQHELPAGGLLLVDGAEQLNRFDLVRVIRRVIKRRQWMLLTSHQRLLRIEVLHRTCVNREMVQRLAKDLLLNAEEAVAQLVDRELQSRSDDAMTDVRQLWFDLYDLVQAELRPTLPPGHTRFPIHQQVS